MLIDYKGIEAERLGDAPFIGALLIATNCHHNCPGCFNQHIRSEAIQRATPEDIMDQVQSNKLHEGVIFGGLEWSEQPIDLLVLVDTALHRHLKVMIYTHLDEYTFLQRFPGLVYCDLWCKFGEYDETKKVLDYQSYGVTLASSNQYVKHFIGGTK